MHQPELIVEAEGLTRRFGAVTAIQDVSFRVPRGDVVGFLGPNGAGKTTTLRILTGLLPADSGYARIAGISLARDRHAVKRRIGYMPENNPLPEDMRVSEYLHLRASLKEVPWRRIGSRVGELLEACDLHRKMAHRVIGTLSKGTRQRVGLAEAMLASPELAILDEPTIGLDPHQVLLIRRLIEQLRGRTTFLLSSHILSEVELSCNRVIIINQGRVVGSGTPEELRREFGHAPRYRIRGLADPATWEAVRRALPAGFSQTRLVTPADGSAPREALLESADPADRSAELLAALGAVPGLTLLGCWRQEATLEEVFFAATRRSWEAEGKSGSRAPFPPA